MRGVASRLAHKCIMEALRAIEEEVVVLQSMVKRPKVSGNRQQGPRPKYETAIFLASDQSPLTKFQATKV
jgi:hypothetical protein